MPTASSVRGSRQSRAFRTSPCSSPCVSARTPRSRPAPWNNLAETSSPPAVLAAHRAADGASQSATDHRADRRRASASSGRSRWSRSRQIKTLIGAGQAMQAAGPPPTTWAARRRRARFGRRRSRRRRRRGGQRGDARQRRPRHRHAHPVRVGREGQTGRRASSSSTRASSARSSRPRSRGSIVAGTNAKRSKALVTGGVAPLAQLEER